MKLKPKKLIKNVAGLFNMTGKKGRKVKSLFVVGGGGGGLYPTFRKPRKTTKRRKRILY